jgi:imidazole glycerol-phosphate synthase subunit HisH
MTARVAIVDYGMGNLRSVANALATLGCSVDVTTRPGALASATHVVLPGVGAFGDGMENLRRGGGVEALQEQVVGASKPFLGICLGMQLLAKAGTEHGQFDGLGLIDGKVLRLAPQDSALRIPHIGWNDVEVVGTPRLLTNLPGPPCFYFVHSYALAADDPAVVSGRCTYGVPFVSCIEHRNIHGVQFHPEKSHKVGLGLLANFVRLESPAC